MTAFKIISLAFILTLCTVSCGGVPVVKPDMPSDVLALPSDECVDGKIIVKVQELNPALVYLRDNQTSDGDWLAKTHRPIAREKALSFSQDTPPESEDGWETDTTANTSLALLCYLMSGFDQTTGPYKDTIRRGLKFLMSKQQADGKFSTNIRHHCLAVIVMAETYGLSGQKETNPIAAKGIQYLLAQQHSDGGFGDDDESNVIDSCYAVMVLQSARRSGLGYNHKCAKTVFAFVETLRKEGSVRYSVSKKYPEQYDNYADSKFPICEAAWLQVSRDNGFTKMSYTTACSVSDGICDDVKLPEWKANNIDCEYYWLVSRSVVNQWGEKARSWKKTLSAQLYARQRGFSVNDRRSHFYTANQLLEHGSWDPAGVNGPRYGRIYSTCMCYLSLGVSNSRYYCKRVEPSKYGDILDDQMDEVGEDPSDCPGLPPIEEEPWGALHWHDTARKPDDPFKSVNK